MEECKDNNNVNDVNNNKKRVREDDSGMNSPESKPTRADSTNSDSSSISCVDSDADSPESKRLRPNSPESTQTESAPSSTESTQIPSDLLTILDDPEAERDQAAIQGLDSVIKSFEDEILFPASQQPSSGDSQPELGYLLEASDDELGLPPAPESVVGGKIDASEFAASSTENERFEGFLGFEDELGPSYDSFGFAEFGGAGNSVSGDNSEYVALGGLFDENNSNGEDFLWRAETMPAL